MPVFVVERYLAGWGPAAVRALVDRVGSSGDTMARREVRHVRSVIVAEDETCLCLFEGPDRETVRIANDEAGLPVDRIVGAEVLPDDR